MKFLFTIAMSFALACSLYSCDTLAEEEAPLKLDTQTTLVVCAAAFIVAGDSAGAGWYATNGDDNEAVVFFTNLFILGLEEEQITSDDVADTIEACIKIRAVADAK